jgi:hypothetical protein
MAYKYTTQEKVCFINENLMTRARSEDANPHGLYFITAPVLAFEKPEVYRAFIVKFIVIFKIYFQ